MANAPKMDSADREFVSIMQISEHHDEKADTLRGTVLSSVRRILGHPTGGIVGLVDELLAVCADHGLEIEWQADHCQVRSIEDGWDEDISDPFPKSILRAVLARVAFLCNERLPNSVSPYGGQMELSVAGKPRMLRVVFVNTSTQQQLKVTTQRSRK